MQQLIINLTEAEHSLLTKKAGRQDLEQITKIALDQYFARHTHTVEPLPRLDLSGLEGRKRYETDDDWSKAVAAYDRDLEKYEAEKARFEEKLRNGTYNEWGGISCTL